MTGFARAVTALLAAAIAACAFLPWVGGRSAWGIPIQSLLGPSDATGLALWASVGAAVCLAAALILIGALLASRGMIVAGSLLAVAIPSVWVLGNVVSGAAGSVTLARVQIGAWATVLVGLLVLVLAAVARDDRSSLR